MARWCLMEKRGKDALKSKTPTLTLATSSVCMRRLTQSLTPGRRSSPSSRSGTNPTPRSTRLPRTRVGHPLRKSSQPTKHSATRPSKEFGSWTQILMLGSTRRLLKASQAGPPKTPRSVTSPSMGRCNPIIQTQWGHPWITWASARSSTVSGLTSMICAGSTSRG